MARQQRDPNRQIEWHFFSFPVLFGFALGAFLVTLLVPHPNFPVFVIFVGSLFGVSFGVAHIVTHWIKRRTLDRARERAEEDERERRGIAARAANAREGAATSLRRRRRRRGS